MDTVALEHTSGAVRNLPEARKLYVAALGAEGQDNTHASKAAQRT